MATIVHAADLHVHSPLPGLRLHYPNEDWHTPTRQALNTLVAATIDESADALVLAGDIVDRDWFNDHVARLLADSLRVLDESGVAIHGRGVPTSAPAEDLVPGFPPARPGLLNVGVLHTSLDRPPPVKPCAPTTTGALVRS